MENYFFLENYGTSEGALSHNVLYYQPLPSTRYQVWFYANNYFESLPIVSTAFKQDGLPQPEETGCDEQSPMLNWFQTKCQVTILNFKNKNLTELSHVGEVHPSFASASNQPWNWHFMN